MAGRNIQQRSSRRYWFVAAVVAVLGSITPDIGHGLNLITGGKVGWGATHTWYPILLWIFVTLLVGLGAAVVLKAIMKAKKCPKLNTCPKIRIVLDKDLPYDGLYVKYIRKVCAKCPES